MKLLNGCLRQGRALDEQFDAATRGLEDRDRAFARLLAATTLRRLGQIDAVLAKYLDREPPALTQDVLRLSAAQILFVGTPVHAAVATGVEMIKRGPQAKFAGLVNAVLRRVSEKGEALVKSQKAEALNTPVWLRDSLSVQYGPGVAGEIGSAHLNEAPVDLTLKDDATVLTWAQALKADVLPTGSLRLTNAGRIEDLPGFAEGAWWVQDAAAALPARILLNALGTAKGRRVIDLCAAPGGKTLQLAAAGCVVTAVDDSSKRLQRVAENLKRTNLKADAVRADVLTWQPAQLADAVLLDAPCSSTGTIRRHPDLPYLKDTGDIARQAGRQRAMLTAAAKMLKPGGVLVYSVCSLNADEGEHVIEAALADMPEFTREPVPASVLGGSLEFLNSRCDLRTLPSHWPTYGGLDGFYAALLRKRV
ncbi:MAG: methyltransferase [Rhodospirillaceae bacterium]|nr:methyltransferase [Rhodospirillaceae bacterium]